MEFEELSVTELRQATRHFIPETRKAGSVAHIGTRDQIVALLRERGIMAIEVREYCESVKRTQGETPDEPVDVKIVEDELIPPEVKEVKEIPEPVRENESDELELIRKIITRNVKSNSIDKAAVESILNEKLDEFQKKLLKKIVKVIEVKQPDGEPNKVIGVCHKLTQQIADVCNLGIYQMLVGPAGSGKTTCCEKVAEILNLKFYPMSVGPQTTKSDLLGFVDAAGNYHSTPLRDAFENGGLLLLDEVDAANAGVLTIINSLLANGYCSFPDGVKKRNENFRCICACNTYGRGADRQYVGRNQLDAATLDRFAVVDFDYDEDFERAIAGNDSWVDKVQAYRKRANELKMRVVISPRASIYGAKLLV